MAIVYATKNGNWSDPTVWNTGALPTSADDVYSNNFTVTIDTSPTVLSINGFATTGVPNSGGTFVLNSNGNVLTANVLSGNTVLTVTVGAGATVGLIGDIVSSTNSSGNSVNFSGVGTFNVTGNITFANSGGSNSVSGILYSGAGTLIFNGICTGSSQGGSSSGALYLIGSGTATITGTCIGGANGSGVNITGTLLTNITATIQGSNTTTGGYGVNNGGSGTLNHIGIVQASSAGPAIGPGSATQVTTLTGPLVCSATNDASAGVNPCIALRWFPADTALSTFQYQMRGATASGSPSVRPVRQLFLTDAYSSGYPAVSNVNNGSTYGPAGIYAGTMNIPNSSTVVLGVPVGTTTGTTTIPTVSSLAPVWNTLVTDITTSGSIGERLKNLATVNTVSQALTNIVR